MHFGRPRRKMSDGFRPTVYRMRPESGISLAHVRCTCSQPLKLICLLMPASTAGSGVPRRYPRNPAAALLYILSVLSFPGLAAAAEWSYQPSIYLALGHDDNPTLTTGPHNNVWQSTVVPRINLGKATEISAVNLDLLVNATQYSGSQVPDTNAAILSWSSFLRTTERTTWGLDGELRQDTLFQTIQTTPGTGNLQDTDVGLVSQKVRRDWYEARPTWRYLLSERSSLGLSYRITDVGFSNASGTGLEDYKNHQLSATYTRTLTVKNDLNVTVNRYAYRPAETGTKSDTTQLLAGLSHAYSETARGRFSAGVGKTSETSSNSTDHSSSFVLEVGMTQRSELTTLDGVISRDVQPSGVGQSVISDQFRMYVARKISPLLDLVVTAKVFRNHVLKGSDPSVDRRFYQLIPALNWRWSPAWTFGTQYSYTRQKFDADPNAAESNALYLTASYAWLPHVASR